MLGEELAGRGYVKSQHAKRVMEETGRTHRSVEFKFQNISAVLEELGLPWIPGYRPKENYQAALFDAIDRFLNRHAAFLNTVPAVDAGRISASDLFVAAPGKDLRGGEWRDSLAPLARKYDPVERDYRNRSLGSAGEEFVVLVEQQRLEAAGRPALARQVRWVARDDGEGAGFDIRSFDTDGRERLLEVKTTNGAARTPFF